MALLKRAGPRCRLHFSLCKGEGMLHTLSAFYFGHHASRHYHKYPLGLVRRSAISFRTAHPWLAFLWLSRHTENKIATHISNTWTLEDLMNGRFRQSNSHVIHGCRNPTASIFPCWKPGHPCGKSPHLLWPIKHFTLSKKKKDARQRCLFPPHAAKSSRHFFISLFSMHARA